MQAGEGAWICRISFLVWTGLMIYDRVTFLSKMTGRDVKPFLATLVALHFAHSRVSILASIACKLV